MIGIRLIFFWAEDSAEVGLRPKNVEPLPRNFCADKTDWSDTIQVVIEVGITHDGCGGKRVRPEHGIAKIRRGNIDVLEIAHRVGCTDRHHAVRMWNPAWIQQ